MRTATRQGPGVCGEASTRSQVCSLPTGSLASQHCSLQLPGLKAAPEGHRVPSEPSLIPCRPSSAPGPAVAPLRTTCPASGSFCLTVEQEAAPGMKILRIKGTSAEAELRGRALLAGVRSQSKMPAAGQERTGGTAPTQAHEGAEEMQGDNRKGQSHEPSTLFQRKLSFSEPRSRAFEREEIQPGASLARSRTSPGHLCAWHSQAQDCPAAPPGEMGCSAAWLASQGFLQPPSTNLEWKKSSSALPQALRGGSVHAGHPFPAPRQGWQGPGQEESPAASLCLLLCDIPAGLQPQEAPNRSPMALQPPLGAGTQGCSVPSE